MRVYAIDYSCNPFPILFTSDVNRISGTSPTSLRTGADRYRYRRPGTVT